VDLPPSLLLGVGEAFVDPTPWLKDFAIATSGTADKIALFVGMGLVLTAVCALVGVVGAPRGDGSTRRRTVGLLLFALVGVVGLGAVLRRPGPAPSTVRRRCWACWSGSAC
jgi:hypothetical protein